MYNKLFTKILDSSIWLEPTSTRIVWITLIAAMDQDGYAHFSAVQNLAERARVTMEECQKAIECFLKPDENSSNPANGGRRIERVPGGFLILNHREHRNVINRTIEREQTRIRVQKHREKHKVTQSNGHVTEVTPSVSVTEAVSEAEVPPNPHNGNDLLLQGGEGVKSFVWKPSLMQMRFNKIFNRRDSTRWSAAEEKSFKALGQVSDDDMKAVEKHYKLKMSDGKDFRRHDLLTLLNNFNGEVDRARKYKEPNCF